MNDHWLEILDEHIDAEAIERRVQENRVRYEQASTFMTGEDLEAIARDTWKEVIGETRAVAGAEKGLLVQERDCDIVPRHYLIDWRLPVLGPINAAIRRLINAEIRRFLLPALEKQSFVNRQLLQAVKDLAEENERLRLEIEKMRNEQR